MLEPVPVAPPLQRTHLAEDDTAWLPAPVRATGMLVAGIGYAVLACVIVALVLVMLFWIRIIWLGVFSVGVFPVAYHWRDAVARGVMRRRMGRLQRSALYLPAGDGGGAGDGGAGNAPVRVRGRVIAQRTLPAFFGERRVVLRRLAFRFYGVHAIHESAVDFLLDDGSGAPVLICVAGARWLEADESPSSYVPLSPEHLATLEALDPTPALADCFSDYKIDAARRGGHFAAASGSEQVVKDGDTVEVVGYRSRVVDQTVTARLERDTPFRAALQGSDELPLLIARG